MNKPESTRMKACVHPLFGWMPFVERSRRKDANEEELKRRYKEKLQHLLSNEFAVIVPSISKEEFKVGESKIAAGVHEIIDGVRKEQLILLFDPEAEVIDLNVERSGPRFKQLKQRMRAKGFPVKTVDAVEVFGESFNVCVENFADNVLREFRGVRPVRIDVHATNFGMRRKYERENKFYERLQELHTRDPAAIMLEGRYYDISTFELDE